MQTADGFLYIAHSISKGTVRAPKNRNQYAEWKEAEEKEDRYSQEEKAVAQGPSQEEETLIVPASAVVREGAVQWKSIALMYTLPALIQTYAPGKNRSCNDFSL